LGNIIVSINCIAYNHEKYIADAIESFLMQQTNFSYEILIHDDASIDRTAEIIREYEKKYPELIKPIYQIENQYSKGVDVLKVNDDRAIGKYVALCEGDDYWTDINKLQKQVDYMEKHPECSLCVHAGTVVSALDKKPLSYIRSNKGNKVFKVAEVIEGGGGLFVTNSMIYPTKFGQNRPIFIENAPVVDYPLAINLSLQGSVYYIDEFMSAYRTGDISSWTARNTTSFENAIKHFNDIEIMLEEINEYTDYGYSYAIAQTKELNKFNLLLNHRRFIEAKTGEMKRIYLKLGFRQKLIIYLKQYFPSIITVLRVFKMKLIR